MTAIEPSLAKQFIVRGSAGLRVWRWGALAIFALVFIATHWPNLRFDASAPSDKFVHAIAFGGLTYLLWRTRWLKHPWEVAICMLIYSAFDESTQSLPFIQRHTSLDDWIADAIGIVVVSIMLWTRPRAQTAVGRMRRALDEAADRDMFDRPLSWMGIAMTGALGVLVGASFALGIGHFLAVSWSPLQVAFYGGIACGLLGLELARQSSHAAAIQRLTRQRACFYCSASIPADPSASIGLCACCGQVWKTAQWVLPTKLFRLSPARKRALVWPSLFISTILIVQVIWPAYVSRGSPVGGLQDIVRLASIAGMMIVIVMLRCLAAHTNARARDREGVECLCCDHDVHTVVGSCGIGRCPECGTEFIVSRS